MVAIDHRNDTFIAGFERSSMRDKGGGVARRLCGRSQLAPLMAFKQVHIILLDWANRISYAHNFRITHVMGAIVLAPASTTQIQP